MSTNQVLRTSLFPELIKAQCTIIGAWGPALATSGGVGKRAAAARDVCTGNGAGLLQVRALDFGLDGPFPDWPVLMVYHHNDSMADKTGLILNARSIIY